jgi:Polysaccharide lyase
LARAHRVSRAKAAAVAVAAAAVVALAALLINAGSGSTAKGVLYFKGDFETGNFKQWTFVQRFKPERASIVRSPVRQGRYAARFVSVAGECIRMDCTPENPRGRTEALLQGRLPTTEGKSLWYRWYTLFPSDGPAPEFTFTQWRANDEQAGPRAISGLYGLMTVEHDDNSPDGVLTFQRNGDRWRAPLRRGRWIKFLVHVKYSSNPAVGQYELWVDDKKVMSFHDLSKPANTGVYFKQGVYRNNGTPTGVAYFDGLRVASTRDVADR